MKISKSFSKCRTILATAIVLGQVAVTPIQVLATENVSKTIDTEVKESTEEGSVATETTESIEASEPIQESKIPEVNFTLPASSAIDNFLASQPLISSGLTADGEQIVFNQRMQSLLREIGNSTGKLTKYYSSTAYISTPYIDVVGGETGAVWCVKPDKPFPVNVEYAKGVYHDEGVYNILYYALQRGWDQPNENYVDVFVALNAYLGHTYQGVDLNLPVFTSDANVSFLLQKARDKDAPSGKFTIKNKVQTADFDQKTKRQFTNWYTPETDGHDITYDIPTNDFDKEVTVELDNGQTFSGKSGTKTIPSNVKFRLTAPANYAKKLNFAINTNQRTPAALIFDPINADVQSVVKAGWLRDPIKVENVQGTFFAREGQLQIGKQDKVTGQMVANTTFEGTIGTDKVTFTTGADGWAPISEKYIDSTPYSLVETAVPEGYTRDQTPITGTIKAGETTKITQQNNHQNAVVTFEKEKEVFDAKETTLKGTPVYKDIPLEGAEFTNKNNNDTTAPDQETVLTPAGEYLDTMLTDVEGKGKSTIPFVNGEQNEYIFDEINEPENYRQFEPVTFNVPYEVSTVDVATYDLGIFKNELKTGEIDFNKKSDLDLSSLLNITGAKIHVEGLSENTKDVNFTFTTSAETNKLKLKEGQYRFSEVEYPDGWTISPNQPHSMIVEVKDKTNSTINWENTKIPMKITTLFATVDGKKVIDPTKDNKLEDTVKVTDAWVNTPMTFYTEFVAVKYNNGVIINQRVVGTDETEKTFKEKSETFKVPLDLKKDTLKEGEALVATHVAKDKDGKVIAEETDLYNKDQTVVTETAKVPEKPKTPVTPSTPTKTGTLPSMGETIQSTFMMIGFAIAALVGFLFVFKKAETDEVA
ncbi:hypothetical protein A5884_003707 [Enterococcus sp. 7D2_DIV0200]|uniref:SpaA isopeptide-forming pilin-related protein n=1 Tax=Enterococcus sp. 7D2_DIV0200 TaxID=1834187 RepID=UPI000A3514A0|nr:SpaA isopeptide-forming pilin-related protein [Enterococcus sp. 7D2_DIV0200]OTP46829.1 hypothetical protein A5884_003707 [Enterococcus sp. 7D2_DIV0200]